MMLLSQVSPNRSSSGASLHLLKNVKGNYVQRTIFRSNILDYLYKRTSDGFHGKHWSPAC
jgi:hypothetical protein